ncbi:hypothetical protein COP2_011187 [Malus domestica]
MSGGWSTGLLDCFSDCSVCCLGFWCPCVVAGRVAEIVSKGETSCFWHGCLYAAINYYTNLACCITCGYRTQLRGQYMLEEKPCNDCCVHFFCNSCALCQEYRELQNRGFDVASGWQGDASQNRGVVTAPAMQGGMNRRKHTGRLADGGDLKSSQRGVRPFFGCRINQSLSKSSLSVCLRSYYLNLLIVPHLSSAIMYSSHPRGYEKYSSSDPQHHHHHHQDAPLAPTGIPVSSSTEPYFTTSNEDMSSHSGHSHMTHPPSRPRPRALIPWSTGLCDCFSDFKNCCITLWCPCITFGRIAEIVDKGSTSCGASGALYTLITCVTACPCCYSCFYRSKMRQQYSLEESPCGDCLVHCFCEHCALCQEYRELQFRGFDLKLGWHGNIEERNREGVAMNPVPPVVEEGMSRDK